MRAAASDGSAAWRGLGEERNSWRRLLAGCAGLVTAAGLAIGFSAGVIEIQAGATAYLVGEAHWSNARQVTVHYLYRYSLYGDAQDLARARAALQVPLGDRVARLELEREHPDYAIARAGLRAGGNAEADIPRLIWIFRNFSRAPFFEEAVRVWRGAEPYIFQLRDIADELEVHWRRPGAKAAGPEVRVRLTQLANTIEPMERRFAMLLLEASAQVRRLLLACSMFFFVVIAGMTVLAFTAALRRIRASESRFRAAFQQATVGMAKLSGEGIVLAANEELMAMLRRPDSTLCGMRFDDYVAAPAPHALPQRVQWAKLSGPIERRIRRQDGSEFWGRITASTVQVQQASDAASVFLIVEDVSEAHQLSETLAYQASHDSLTRLINRREIESRLEALLAQTRGDGVRHTLCYVDLDQFKLVNDTCSHAAGDYILCRVAITLGAKLGHGDWVGRLGGDEFAVLFANTGSGAAYAKAEALRRALADSGIHWEGRPFSMTASIGLVEISRETSDVAWLLRAADTACYLAKDAGRNCTRVYAESNLDLVRCQRDMAWANQVRAAIAEDRLQLYAQRIVPLHDTPSGMQYEVLVRMLDAGGKLCLPGTFLPAAERYGQALDIDTRVLAMTIALLARHPQHLQALELCHLNVSGQSVVSPDFRVEVEGLLDANPAIAQRLCFELTETASIGNLAEARNFIGAVRARGCKVALDDFGSGLSSFAYLKNLPVDILKIDGMFVRDIAHDALDLAVVKAVTEVARSQDKCVVAEWAETAEVLALLREIGVDAAQGFALHHPCPLTELVVQGASTSRESA